MHQSIDKIAHNMANRGVLVGMRNSSMGPP